MARTPNVVDVLVRHGLAPGPDGFVQADLEAAITARSWRAEVDERQPVRSGYHRDRKSTRLNSSHSSISYAVFCLKKKKKTQTKPPKNTKKKKTKHITTCTYEHQHAPHQHK